MGQLEDSLRNGLAAMQGKGVDPATLYGMPGKVVSAPPPTGAWSAYGNVGNGGAPSSNALPLDPSSMQTTTGVPAPAPVANTMPVGSPSGMPNAATAAGSGAQANISAPIGHNTFGLDPRVSLRHIMDYLLPRVKDLESEGNYKADRATKYPGQTASGAYQYTDGTWGGYGGFARAVDAPPEIQDKKAREDFQSRLGEYGNDPFKAAAGHYFPRYAHDPKLWDQPLKNSKGEVIPNSMPVRNYLNKVFPPDRVANYMKTVTQ